MLLNKGYPVRTLKSKLAWFYVALFMVTQLLCMAVIYFCQQHSVYSDARKKAAIFSDEFTYEYMTGAEFSYATERFSPDRIDDSILSAVNQIMPGFMAETAYVDPLGDTTVLGVASGKVYAFTSSRTNATAISRVEYNVTNRVALMDSEFNEESYGEDVNHIYFLVLSPEGKLLAKSGFNEVSVDLFLKYKLPPHLATATLKLAHEHDGIFTHYHRLFDGNILVVGEHMHQFNKYTVNLVYSILATLILSLVVSIYSGRLIAGRFVNGIKRITNAARSIESGNYSERVSHGREGAEINDLADAFNDMTGNTEKLLRELKSISDNMAHDLRTPITRMRGQAEMSLYASKESELASDVAEECANMLTMINAMLEITQTECNINNPARENLDFAAIARDTTDLLSTVADDKGVSIKSDIPETPLLFCGSKVQLQRLLANLLDNAIKFTPSGGTVSISMKRDQKNILLTVADTGCGIPERDQPRVFDRFYRSDSSRNIPGNGLGLSLVKAIVESYDGTISFTSVEGRGTVFTLTLLG